MPQRLAVWWLLLTARALFGKADLTMALNGGTAGLVAITAEPSTPTALQAHLLALSVVSLGSDPGAG